jgi:phage-related minor tail protein
MADSPEGAAVVDPAVEVDVDVAAEKPIVREDDWQTKARKHERDLKKERKAREEMEARLEEFANASKSEQEKALEKARAEAADAAKAEVRSEFQDRILNAEIRAQAAGKFANPNLAAKLLDLDHDDVFDEAGDVNADAIRSAIDEFLEAEENHGLKAGPVVGQRPLGSADGGKGAGAGPTGTPEEQHNQWLAGLLQRP